MSFSAHAWAPLAAASLHQELGRLFFTKLRAKCALPHHCRYHCNLWQGLQAMGGRPVCDPVLQPTAAGMCMMLSQLSSEALQVPGTAGLSVPAKGLPFS